MIRPLEIADVPRARDWLEGVWRASRLGRWSLNLEVLAHTLTLVAGHNGGLTFSVLSEEEGQVRGLFVGAISRLYAVSDDWEATDTLWLGEGRDALAMVKAFHAWAWAKPEVVRIRQGVVDTMGEISPAAVRFLEREGFVGTGIIYERGREL